MRVASEAPVGGFLPRANVGFQVKKTDFTPSLIEPEMRPSGNLRPSIQSLIDLGGSYIIVSSGSNTSDTALNDRLGAMQSAVKHEDPAEAIHLDFYDRNRLATWVRSRPGLMLWVKRRIGRAVSGWKPYEAWASSPEGVADIYLMDDEARLHAGTRDEKGISVTNGIKRIREALNQPRGIVRLAGLSGVGKTRFVQALFDARIGEPGLDPALAVYTDMNDNPDPQPTGMVHDLIAARSRAIVVVDNCAPDLHRRLTEICRSTESSVSVITVEYDVQDDEPEGTEVFRLEPSAPGLVAKLLERRFPDVSQVDINTIAEFSGGNARVALALANTLERNETLAELKDEELFKRLFHQRQVRDTALLTAAQACALVYSFQGEALSGPTAELPVLGALVGMSAQELFAKVAELRQRDLVQRRGEWRAVLPHAIANRLAQMALKTIPVEVIETYLVTERLMRSFSRRLGYLHDSPEATQVVQKWLGSGGLLENVATLNELGLAMFNNVAPVSPPTTLASIERALRSEGFLTEFGRGSRIGLLLRSLAYDADLFDRAASALLILVDAEPGDQRSHPVEDSFVGLFCIYLSGTHATVEQRTRIVEAQLRSSDARRQALGVKLLDTMLRTTHFSSGHSFEFGSRHRDFGYWPTKRHDVERWYLAVLSMAGPLALSDLRIAKAIASEIAGAFRGLWYVSQAVQDQLEHIAKGLLAKEYWQEGWIAVRTVLSYGSDKADADAVTRLKALEKILRPKNVAEQVRAVVLTQTWGRLDYADMDEGNENADNNPTEAYERANKAAEELGKEVAQDEKLFNALLPDLVRGSAGRLSIFGRGLGLSAKNRRGVFGALARALGEVPEKERNVGTLCGFMIGVREDDMALSENLLDESLEHDTLGEWFPILQTSVPITKEGTARLKLSLALGKAPLHTFRFLGWGRSSDAISGADLKELLLTIADRPSGFGISAEILSMRLHSDNHQKLPHPPELVETGRELLSRVEFDDHDNMHDYRLSELVNACLRGKAGEEPARKLCERFKAGVASYSVYAFRFDHLVASLFKTQPRVVLDVFFGGKTANDEHVVDVDAFDDLSDHRRNPLDAVPEEEILAWCAEGGQARYLAIANAVSYLRQGKDTPPGWTTVALRLLEVAPDPLGVLAIFVRRFSPRSWSGSRAAIMESRAHLLDDLAHHSNPSIAAFAVEKRPELLSNIAREREHETRYDRERDERFE